MASKLNPYISFQGNTREVMEFYKTVFGGELEFMTFGDAQMSGEGIEADKIMHSSLVAKNGITIMAADTATGMREYKKGNDISISLSGDDEAELSGYYNKLVEGGKEEQPLTKAPWGDTFGMCIDKYGIFWMVNIVTSKN